MGYNWGMVKKILIVFFSLLLIGAACFYNAVNVNPTQFKIREETIITDKIDEDLDGFLVAYFTDLSLNDKITDTYVDEVFAAISSFKPEMIVFGGDLLDQDASIPSERIDHLVEKLSDLHAPYGKYAVLGDQDMRDPENISQKLNDAGFKILNNAGVLISKDNDSYFNIVGIEPLVNGSPDLASAFSYANANYYTLVTSHCPDIFDSILGYHSDLLLSGHSRGGQIYIPLLSLFGRDYGCKKYYHGKTTKDGTTIDVSNGLGMIGDKARFLADAEIVLYTFRSAD